MGLAADGTYGYSGVITVDIVREIACADFMIPDLTFAAAELDPGVALLPASVIILTTQRIFVDSG